MQKLSLEIKKYREQEYELKREVEKISRINSENTQKVDCLSN